MKWYNSLQIFFFSNWMRVKFPFLKKCAVGPSFLSSKWVTTVEGEIRKLKGNSPFMNIKFTRNGDIAFKFSYFKRVSKPLEFNCRLAFSSSCNEMPCVSKLGSCQQQLNG
jgi:hypothetical protein